jgi:hypothetical protein
LSAYWNDGIRTPILSSSVKVETKKGGEKRTMKGGGESHRAGEWNARKAALLASKMAKWKAKK